MDGPEFDAWTRRRFGLATGGALAALAALAEIGESEATKKSKKRRKRRKKRCKRLGDRCRQSGKQKCCGKLQCDHISFEPSPKTRCCRKEGHPCGDHLDCCDSLCCQESGLCGNACFSDRNLKSNLGSVDPIDMLMRVRDLPISTWNYTSDDPAIRHIGPMAQDFAALFGVGADDRHIHPLDGQGVALAAIQGLVAQIEELRQENDRLAARIVALERGGQ